LDDKFDDALE
jgi:hypothetical protein